MIKISISDNYTEFAAGISALERRHLPFAASRALTATAKSALADVKSDMLSIFDRPTPFTRNSFFIKASSRTSLEAYVGVRDNAQGALAAGYLGPESSGGPRVLKPFEKALDAAGGAGFAVPTRDAPLDQYGNVPAAYIAKIIAALRGNTSERRTRKLRRKGLIALASVGRKSEFFVTHGSSGRPIAIYEVMSAEGRGPGRVRPVFWFDQAAPKYRPIFPFHDIVGRSIEANFGTHMAREFADAVATAAARGK